MACGDYSKEWPAAGIEALTQGNLMDGVLCVHQMQYGGLVFGLLVLGTIGVVLTTRTESVGMPLVVFIFVGAIVLQFVPSFAVTFAVLLMLVGIPAGGYLLVRKIDTP